MPTDFNIPAIAAWVAEKLPKEHAYSGMATAIAMWLRLKGGNGEYVASCIAESLLLDALESSGSLANYSKELDTWEVVLAEGLTVTSAVSRLSALLAAVQAIIDQQQETKQ